VNEKLRLASESLNRNCPEHVLFITIP
jgi:hypothetical protein